MTAAFHILTRVAVLRTGGSFVCVFWHMCSLHLIPCDLYDAHSHTLIQVSVVYFPGCPGAKKTEFLTSVLDALSTDMVHAVTDPASAGRCDTCSSQHYWCISLGSVICMLCLLQQIFFFFAVTMATDWTPLSFVILRCWMKLCSGIYWL